MQRGKIILVEGISNAGKSTLCKNLADKNDFIIIPEGIRYLERRLHEEGDDILLVPETTKQEKLNQGILFDIEFERIFDANFYANKGANVVIDKSGYSIVATAYAFEQVKKFENTFNYAEYKMQKLIEKISEYDLSLPDVSVLLKANRSVSNKRNHFRKHVLKPVWVKESIRQKQEYVLEKEIKFHCKNGMVVDTTDLSSEQVYKKILKEITPL